MSPLSNQLPAEHELQAFVDSIESGVVKLLLQDAKGEWHGHLLPEAVLPPNTKEGSPLAVGNRHRRGLLALAYGSSVRGVALLGLSSASLVIGVWVLGGSLPCPSSSTAIAITSARFTRLS